MLKLPMFISSYRTWNKVVHPFKNIRNIFSSATFCDESKDDADEEPKPTPASNKEDVEKKLNDLLILMTKQTAESSKKINIPKPRPNGKEKYQKHVQERNDILQQKEKEKLSNRLAEAASKVAETLGGDTAKTEEELLELYLYGTSKPTGKTTGVKKPKENLKNLLSSMKIETSPKTDSDDSRANQIRSLTKNLSDSRPTKTPILWKENQKKINIFGEEPLNLFLTKEEDDQKPLPTLRTWDFMFQRDLRLSVTHPPANIFEQLILWTEQGKIWKFPIDNEQDWFDEQNVDFTEHVFLERWIEPWCPKTGPIRHFMELVCTGLSKNPYFTVEEKRQHISFYENYFRAKNDLLEQLGVGTILEKENQQLAE